MIEEEARDFKYTGIEADSEIDLHLEVIKDRLTQPITAATPRSALIGEGKRSEGWR